MWSPWRSDMGGGYTTQCLLDCSADPGRVREGQGPHSSFLRKDAQGPLWPLLALVWVGYVFYFILFFFGGVWWEESRSCLKCARSVPFWPSGWREVTSVRASPALGSPRLLTQLHCEVHEAEGQPRAPCTCGSSDSLGAQQPVSCPPFTAFGAYHLQSFSCAWWKM